MTDYLAGLSEDFALDSAPTALLVVDMQYATGSREHGLGRVLRETGREDEGRYRFDRIESTVVPNVQRLLAMARGRDLPVIYLTVGSLRTDYLDLPGHMRNLAKWVGNTAGSLEHEILGELKPAPNDLVLNKTTTSGFLSSGLDHALRTLGTRNVIVTGISTNSCVETTARDGADLGYRVLLVDDACGAARQEFHDATVRSFRRLFGRVATTEEVLSELRESTK